MQLELVGDLGVCKVLKEPLILVLSDLTLVTVPDGLQRVDQLAIQLDRVGNEQRVLFENLLDLCLSAKLAGLRLQLQ